MYLTVNGVWLQWSIWSQCDSTCGLGKTSRNRICDQPQNGGRDCEGEESEVEICEAENKCPGNYVTNLQNMLIVPKKVAAL